MAKTKNLMVQGTGIATSKEFSPAETGFNATTITGAGTYTGNLIDVSGYVSYMISIITAGGASAATTGVFTLKLTGYAQDNTTVIFPTTSIAVQSGNISNGRVHTVAWIEGDAGEGENVTSVDCKSAVSLQWIKLSLTVATGYDNGAWTCSVYVVASR